MIGQVSANFFHIVNSAAEVMRRHDLDFRVSDLMGCYKVNQNGPTGHYNLASWPGNAYRLIHGPPAKD